MPVILDHEDHGHWRILADWEAAAERHNAEREWFASNPRPDDKDRAELNEWIQRRRAYRQQIGLPDYCQPGQIEVEYNAYSMKLARLTRDDNDQPLYGNRVVACRHCSTLFATFERYELHCSAECKAAEDAAKAQLKAKRRRERSVQRSEALANRYGICLACGEQFTLKRITAKTCSETCRKRLQRKPELAEEHLRLPAIRPDLDQLEAAVEQRAREAKREFVQIAQTGQRPAEPSAEAKAERVELKRTVLHQRCLQRLHEIATDAPALTAWLCQQPEDTVTTAFSPEYSGLILGPDLKERLGITRYTDGNLWPAVRWGYA